jgi:hypothetical protein
MWKIELYGEANDILDLKQLAPCCDCALVMAPDFQYCLSGTAFDQVTTAEEIEAKAEDVLTLLNGLARLERFEHRPVAIGERIYAPRIAGAPPFYQTRAPKSARQSRSMVSEFALPGHHSSDWPIEKGPEYECRKRMVSDPEIAGILRALADEINWQRLRVAFEKICALVTKSNSKGKWDNGLVCLGYASQDELKRFKENAEDPRHSGMNAVHGVAGNPFLRTTKMTEKESFEFIVRLLNTYTKKNA